MTDDGIIYILLQQSKKMCEELINEQNPIMPHLVSFDKEKKCITVVCLDEFFGNDKTQNIFFNGLRLLRQGKVPHIFASEIFTVRAPQGIVEKKAINKWGTKILKKYGQLANHPDAKDYMMLKCFDGEEQSGLMAPILTTDKQRNLGDWFTSDAMTGKMSDD